MILNNIYEKFVEHTGLNDAIYKTVFIQIGDVLQHIKDIKWISIKYNISNDNYTYTFTPKEEIPLYVVEIMQNLFDNAYSFPESSTIELELEYKGISYKIICEKDDVVIPPDIMFLAEYSLFDFFLITRQVYDIFSEFDELFRFTDTFKTKIDKIFTPLRNKFEDQVGHEEIDKGKISVASVSSTNTLIENLKKSRSTILQKLDNLNEQKHKLIQSKNEVLKAVKSKKGCELERKNLSIEYDILKEDYDKYKKDLYKIIDMIAEIDSQLETMSLDKETVDISEQEYLKDRKVVFAKQQKELEETSGNTKSLMDNVSMRLVELNNFIKKIQRYTMNDVDALAQKIENIDKHYKETYVALTTTENEIKQQSLKVISDSTHIEKEKNRTGKEGLDQIATQDIITHLSSPLQPTSVTLVMNYLRYFFTFYVSKISVELMDIYKDFDAPTLQAVACKLVLTKFFGVFYNNIFSSVQFVDNRVKDVIFVNGQEL